MPHAKSLAALGAAAMLLCGCSAVAHPPQGRGRVDDPVTAAPDRLACLLSHQIPARKVGMNRIQIGALPAGPTVHFVPSNAVAEALKVTGAAQGAEMIGNALVYPHQASDSELTQVEDCVAKGML
jgi:hypothetical protein